MVQPAEHGEIQFRPIRAEGCNFFFQAEDGIRDFSVTGVLTLLFRSLITSSNKLTCQYHIFDVSEFRGESFEDADNTIEYNTRLIAAAPEYSRQPTLYW